jgi:hypothetical protein
MTPLTFRQALEIAPQLIRAAIERGEITQAPPVQILTAKPKRTERVIQVRRRDFPAGQAGNRAYQRTYRRAYWELQKQQHCAKTT